VRLRILGDGDLQSDLRALAQRLSITDAVSFEGFSLDTPAFLANTDVYVISSLSEGLPLTLLEAMAAGVPVVATAVGGIPEVIDKAKSGWVCPPNNPEALADAMRQALLAPDLATIGARGRAAAKKSFSIQRMARDYEDLYHVLLG
jgi:glycosyltransferase involved in cell wall biosynthesis